METDKTEPEFRALPGQTMEPEMIEAHKRAFELTRNQDEETLMSMAFWAIYRLANNSDREVETYREAEAHCYVLATIFRQHREEEEAG